MIASQSHGHCVCDNMFLIRTARPTSAQRYCVSLGKRSQLFIVGDNLTTHVRKERYLVPVGDKILANATISWSLRMR